MSVDTDDDVTTSRPAARRPRSTPRKAAAKKAVAAPVKEPEAEALPYALNLDELEREGAPEQPFAFIHQGRQYILDDPHEKDWQRLVLVISNPVQFLRLVLKDEDRDAFFSTPMAAWKLRALTQGYQKHYGMGTSGESEGLPV